MIYLFNLMKKLQSSEFGVSFVNTLTLSDFQEAIDKVHAFPTLISNDLYHKYRRHRRINHWLIIILIGLKRCDLL